MFLWLLPVADTIHMHSHCPGYSSAAEYLSSLCLVFGAYQFALSMVTPFLHLLSSLFLLESIFEIISLGRALNLLEVAPLLKSLNEMSVLSAGYKVYITKYYCSISQNTS